MTIGGCVTKGVMTKGGCVTMGVMTTRQLIVQISKLPCASVSKY